MLGRCTFFDLEVLLSLEPFLDRLWELDLLPILLLYFLSFYFLSFFLIEIECSFPSGTIECLE